MTEFFRFPHTPHLAWLGRGTPRDDKVLSPAEAEALLGQPVVVEEKIDGANLGISVNAEGELLAQNRGQYLIEPYSGQFSRLSGWLVQHRFAFNQALGANLILFGEWCAARHSLEYAGLPDWFVVFDVFDRRQGRFWSSARRDELAAGLGLAVVPRVYGGSIGLSGLKALLETSTSHYRTGPPEGLVIRQESVDWCESRAKLVRAEFTQTINEHWRSRAIEWNRLAPPQS